MNVELYIDNVKINEWDGWKEVRILVERNEETWNISASLENIVLLGQDFARFLANFETSPFRRQSVRLVAGGVALQGFVDYTSVKIGDGRLVFSAALDEKTLFEREVAGQLIRADGNMRVSVERQLDAAIALAYIVAAALYLEVAVRNTIRIKKDVADVIAILSTAGPGSPAASVKLAIVRIVLRAIYTAIVIVALAKLFQLMVRFIPEPRQVKYANVANAIRRVCGSKGFRVEFPPGTEKLFIFGDTIDTIEVVELIKVVQTITNTRLFVKNNVIRFEPRRVVPFPFSDRAYVEYYTLNLNEIYGREVISLARDPADFHATDLPHNVEIILDEARGFRRTIIPFAPAKAKVKLSVLEAVLNEIIEFFRQAWVFSKNRTVTLRYVSNIPVVQDITFLPRIIYTGSVSNYAETDEKALLKYIEQNYLTSYIQAKRYEAKMFLALEEFQQLAEAAFPGVVRMSYAPASEVAEVTYELPTSFATRERRSIIT